MVICTVTLRLLCGYSATWLTKSTAKTHKSSKKVVKSKRFVRYNKIRAIDTVMLYYLRLRLKWPKQR